MNVSRDFLLALSRSKFLRASVVKFPPARRTSRKFVAGETLGAALDVIARLNAKNIGGILDFLGENTTSDKEATDYTSEQVAEVEGIADRKLNSYVSLKLTAMGLDISLDMARDNLRRVLACAREHGVFVRVDMEDSSYVERTLALFSAMRAEGFANVGVVIQSCLRRSEDDLRALLVSGANVRLVKGAYREPPDRAYPDKPDVDSAYVRMMKLMLSDEARAAGAYACIATHDEAIIAEAKAHVAQTNAPRDSFEFQMLYGIKSGLHEQLANEGYRFRAYIPYGTHWWPYFMRRLAERPENVGFVLKGAFR